MADYKNPPAFPVKIRRNTSTDPFATPREIQLEGMSLRDWFAGQALSNPVICTGKAPEYHLRRWFSERGGIKAWEIAAKQAGEYADAMLAERAPSPSVVEGGE